MRSVHRMIRAVMGDAWADWVEGIYAAGMGEQTWEAAVAPVKRRFRCSCFALVSRDTSALTPLADLFHPDLAEEAVARYADFDDPLRGRVVERSPGKLMSTADLGLEPAYRDTPYFKEWAEPLGLHHSLVSWHAVSEERFFAAGLHRRYEDGAFESHEVDALERIIRHFARAARIHDEVQTARHALEAAQEQLARRSSAALIMNARREVVWRSTKSERVVASHPSASLDGGQLRFSRARDREAFQQALERACDHLEPTSLRAGHGLYIEIEPMHERLIGHAQRCVVFLTDPGYASRPARDWLEKSYGLTRSEAEVALCLSDGLPTRDIANQRGVAEGTVRNQLKQVFSKLGVSRQVDVVRLLSRLPDARTR